MKKYPPFCIHAYLNKVTDFPFCSPDFKTEKEAIRYAATHYFNCTYVRLGYWTAPSYPDKYFMLEDLQVQNSLL